MHKSQNDLSKELRDASKMIMVGGLYVHYKNPDKVYKVLNLAITESDDKICVIYEAQYGDKLIFVRPLTSWLDNAEFDGKKMKRFTRLA